ncbi:hypothetical protein BD309DRAFT_989365 [Dichomitus squalens]|uniref:Uncharacterized protein n=1 Tax=Dichomitus squalens TaxID=114155 RepID=A0A4Q9P105_9APHY|nr:hypothetical protein BD309DRAFT_989365 [Dichomitus squalens]TBU62791.1 hypothetical protein BD310DRAFT_810064 [Dichomitus squalens]
MALFIEGIHQGGPGTGSLGGPPSGHNYKRAVYRPAPKEFTVEVLPPTKFGSGFCYGMRIFPLETGDIIDSRSTKSGSSWNQEYDIWRRWEDCLWFQEILEGEYSLMARQKRSRLAAGKGVKKNGVYIHSDQAASFESLPPGPDANTIAKDIHEHIPRLTKKGTLFRASQSTIEQRGREFEALIYALWQPDVPMLIKELRDTKLIRDFFGFWRRDQDHERKRQSGTSKSPGSVRNSVSSSAFSMYFSASTLSLSLPNAYADLPPSPALPTFQSPPGSPRQSSFQRDNPRRRSTGSGSKGRVAPPVTYATSDSSASTLSVGERQSPSPVPGDPAQDMTFYVSARGSLALNTDDADTRAEYVPSPLSARVQPQPWMRRSDYSFPPEDIGQDEIVLAPEAEVTKSPGEFHPGLQALPEDSELVPVSPRLPVASGSGGAYDSDTEEGTRIRVRRARNNSCPDRSNRQCLFLAGDVPKSAHSSGAFSILEELRLDTRHIQSAQVDDQLLRTPTHTSSSRTSSVAFSNFSGAGESWRSSWRTSMASESSNAQSFATGFSNGSCADFDPRDNRHSIASTYSTSTSGRHTALARRQSMETLKSIMSDLTIDSTIAERSFTPPPHADSSLRRSLSAGSRRPVSIMATLEGQEDYWNDQQDDLIDAYFYDPDLNALHPNAFEEPPRTPPPAPQQQLPSQREPSKEISTPDRFPKPFQNRPPGQFHLPWSPPTIPGLDDRPTSVPVSAPPVRSDTSWSMNLGASSPPNSPMAMTESITLKAVLQESIVLLRVPRAAPLQEVRTRLRDKFAAQEGVQLSRAFVVGWAPSASQPGGGVAGMAALRGRPRSNSASSVGTLNPQALRYVYTEQEWRAAVDACAGGKMTIRLFNAQPI